jgi:hypothetical protein
MSRRVLALAAAAACLPGCAGVSSVKDVLADPNAYLTQFAPANVPPELLKQLPRNEPAVGFSRLELQTEIVDHGEDKPERRLVVKSVYVNAGPGGLVESYDEYQSNGLPYRINYKLSYRGMYQVRWQTVFHNAARTNPMSGTRSFERADSLPAHVSSRTPFEEAQTYGSISQLHVRHACTVGERKPASTLLPELGGDAIEVDCDTYGNNGQVGERLVWAYLEKYGIAVILKTMDASSYDVTTLKAVHVS